MGNNKAISRKEIAKHSGITWKDILFYSLGDFGICLVFACANVLLNKYYTSCLMFNPVYIIIIFVIARVWDAINDPIMGRIADKLKPNKHGKFRRWFLYISLPLAISTVLMFCQNGANVVAGTYNQNWWQYVLACVTYILFGMSMTAIQIPYGSLASVVTLDSKERSKLSIARGIAGNLGGLPVLAVKALCFKKKGTASYVDYKPLIIGVAILAVFSVLFMMLCYKFTKERSVPDPAPHEKGAFVKALKRINGNRAMISICVISIIVAGGGMFKSVITPFVSADFFGYSGAMTILPEIFDGVGIAITMFLVPVVSRKLGKKESAGLGLYFSTVINIAIMFLFFMLKFNDKGETLNATAPYILFVVGNFLSGLGAGFFSCLLWGMVADAVDDIQIKTGIREDGTSYSILMFFRKIGQTFSFVIGQVILIVIGYVGSRTIDLTIVQKTTLWFSAMGVLIACYGIGALLFTFWFPIDKNKLEEIQDAKELMLEKKAAKSGGKKKVALAKAK